MSQNSISRLKTNNLDLLRFLLALTVCLVHSYDLSGISGLYFLKNYLSSTTAVQAFFVISGFLIFMSFEKSSGVQSYFAKRLRRIYPLYFFIVMLAAIGLLAVSENTAENYFTPQWVKYVIANLLFLNFLQPTLPGVFETNAVQVVNGALWTLKIEVMFYLSVPVFVYLFRRFNRGLVLFSVYCLSIFYSEFMLYMATETGADLYFKLERQLPGQLSYFFVGAFLFYYLEFFEKNLKYFVIAAFLVLVVNEYQQLRFLLPFAFSIIVIFIGIFFYLGNFGKYGDFSYGLYIVHFPIIQLFVSFNWFNDQPLVFLVSILILSIGFSILLWHLIEKRFLQRNNHYVVSTGKSSNSV